MSAWGGVQSGAGSFTWPERADLCRTWSQTCLPVLGFAMWPGKMVEKAQLGLNGSILFFLIPTCHQAAVRYFWEMQKMSAGWQHLSNLQSTHGLKFTLRK